MPWIFGGYRVQFQVGESMLTVIDIQNKHTPLIDKNITVQKMSLQKGKKLPFGENGQNVHIEQKICAIF